MASFPKVKMTVNQGEINGFCDARFARVVEEFQQNFQQRGEVGASVCVTLEGETVVDMWGGIARPVTNAPWKEDTISVVFSSTKGATSLCAHILASRGKLDLDAPVAQYWPEFAQGGKEAIPVKMLLNHQAGLAGVRDLLPPGAFFNWEGVIHAGAPGTLVEAWQPAWLPCHDLWLVSGRGRQKGFGKIPRNVLPRGSGRAAGTGFLDWAAGGTRTPDGPGDAVTPSRPRRSGVSIFCGNVGPDLIAIRSLREHRWLHCVWPERAIL